MTKAEVTKLEAIINDVMSIVESGFEAEVTKLDDNTLQRIVYRLRKKGYVLGLRMEVERKKVHHHDGTETTTLVLRRYLYAKGKEERGK